MCYKSHLQQNKRETSWQQIQRTESPKRKEIATPSPNKHA
jgi:hypothetical protein